MVGKLVNKLGLSSAKLKTSSAGTVVGIEYDQNQVNQVPNHRNQEVWFREYSRCGGGGWLNGKLFSSTSYFLCININICLFVETNSSYLAKFKFVLCNYRTNLNIYQPSDIFGNRHLCFLPKRCKIAKINLAGAAQEEIWRILHSRLELSNPTVGLYLKLHCVFMKVHYIILSII